MFLVEGSAKAEDEGDAHHSHTACAGPGLMFRKNDGAFLYGSKCRKNLTAPRFS